jgi:hypothetical protein
MRRQSLGPGFLLLFSILLWQASAHAQQAAGGGAHAGAQGTLAVTATVVASVGVAIGPDGEQHVFIANAPDPADNVSRLQPVVMVQLTPAAGDTAKPKTKKRPRQNN